MKRSLLTLALCLVGVTLFAQIADVESYRSRFKRADGTFDERLKILEQVRDARLTRIGEFYHDSLKFLLSKGTEINSKADRRLAEHSAIILCEGLGAEKFHAAASDIWDTAVLFDVARNADNEGVAMEAALIALGQVDGIDYLTNVVQRLNSFNTQNIPDIETKTKVQRGVTGCVKALEYFKDIEGYRPVFFVSIGNYDTKTQQMASNTLPNIVDDPSEILSVIIREASNNSRVKLAAWKELLRTKAPGSSKAQTAAEALATGWNYFDSDANTPRNLADMRKGAIDIIRQFGITEDSVYVNLQKSYQNNFILAEPDYDEIRLALNALEAIKTDEAVEIIFRFLRELDEIKQLPKGPWKNKEKQCFELVIKRIGGTGTTSSSVRNLLTSIQGNKKYSSPERKLATDALKALGF